MSYTGEALPLKFHSINWREMHAAAKAITTLAPELSGQRDIFHINNSAVCGILNKYYTPASVRFWCLTIEAYSIATAVVYIATDDNVDADMLSRGKLEIFVAGHRSGA